MLLVSMVPTMAQEKKSEEKKPVAAAERSVAKTAERHDRSAASRRTQNNGIFRFGRRK